MAKEQQKTILASAARTADVDVEFTQSGTGGLLIIDATLDPAAASVVFTLQGIDSVSLKKYTILTSAAITGVGTTILRIFPGSTVTANLAANDFLPQNLNLNANHADADSITYSVGFIGF